MDSMILTLLERPEAAAGLLAAAGRLAALMGGAGIRVLAVRLPPTATILPSEEVLTAEQEARLRDGERTRAARLRAIFEDWASRSSPGDAWEDWEEVEGLAADLLRERGRRADALVLERPADRGLLARREVHTALTDTGRPVLVVPPGLHAGFGRRIGIAWRDDPCATRAVLSALRLRLAPERIFVLSGQREGTPRPEIPAILRERGVEAELHVLSLGAGVFGEALLARAHQLGADMLIMGAYQHSPLREFFLGGVTRFMLRHADLPVLMRH